MTIRSAEEFVRLRTSQDPEEYGRAASEDADESVWFEIVRDYPDMRQWVAHNKSVPLTVLGVLAADGDRGVRWMVASKRKLTHDLFDLLAGDPDEGVRARLAANAKVPQTVLEKLSEDPSPLVRAAAESALGKR